MFQTVPLSIIRSFHRTHSNGICHTGLLTACEQDQEVRFFPTYSHVFLPTYCKCRGLILHLITLSDTHTHTKGKQKKLGKKMTSIFRQNAVKLKYVCPYIVV